MIVKKCGKIITGCQMTKEEAEAVKVEMKKTFADWDDKHAVELDAMYLYAMRNRFGFGDKRLKEAFCELWVMFNDLKARYELDGEDMLWLYTKKLKDKGIDVEAWANEMETVTVNLD